MKPELAFPEELNLLDDEVVYPLLEPTTTEFEGSRSIRKGQNRRVASHRVVVRFGTGK